MKPKKLVMQAFGSYGKKTEIDFTKTKQNLFLITGDTGSGKTTIFDAIVFALFGESCSSGYNKREGMELQSHFNNYEDEPFVEFTFTERNGSREEEYRIQRIPRHKGRAKSKKGGKDFVDRNAKVSLFLPDSTEYSNNIMETNNKIEEIIKLNKDQFMQISMIAQGEFMELLKGDKDKKEIFRKLFNTEIYSELTDKLGEKNKEKEKEINEFGSRCRTIINGVKVPERLADKYESFKIGEKFNINDIERAKENLNKLYEEMKDIRKADREEYDKLSKVKADKTLELEKGKDLIKSFENLERYEKELVELEAQSEEMDRLGKLSKDIEIAYEIKGIYDNFIEAKKSFEDTSRELAESKKRLPELDKAYKERAKEEADFRAEYDKKKDDFTIISEKVKKVLADFSNIEGKKLEKADQEAKMKNAVILIEKATQELADFEICVESWKKEKDERINLETTLMSVKNKISSTDRAAKDLDSLISDNNVIFDEKKKIEEKEKKYLEESETLCSSEKQLSEMRMQFNDLRAGIIARTLKAGEPCPVCGSLSHPSPCRLPENQREITEEEINEFDKKVSRLRESAGTKSAELEGLRARLIEKENKLAAGKEKLAKFIKEELAISNIEENFELEKAGKELSVYLSDEKKKESKLNSEIVRIKSVEEKLSKADETKKELKEKVEEEKENETKISNLISGIESSIKTLELGLAYKTKEEALSLEKNVKDERNTAENLYLTAKKKAEDAKSDKERTETLISKYEMELPESEKTYRDKETIYEKSVSDNGISEENWKNIVNFHDKSEKDDFQKRINDYKEKKAAAKASAERMKEDTAGKNKPDISVLKKDSETIEEAYDAKQKEFEEINLEYRVNEDIIRKLDNELTGREKVKEEFALINNLYKKLSGKISGAKVDIETFVQRRYLERILSSANKRFERMSAGQFELRMYDLKDAGEGNKDRGLNLMVYSFITGKTRDVKTLSGGESFMAALSLALGMADQIKERSGAVNLDMMFLDEGFGTLDDNSRNQAVKILKNMAGGSKLIGIISHVTELKQEIDEQLVVTKDDYGSKVRWQLN